MRLAALSLFLFTLLTTGVHAQTAAPKEDAHAEWLLSGNHSDYGNVEVITLTDPGNRRHCRVHSVTPDSITCGVGVGRKSLTFRREDIAAIVSPPDHSGEHFFFLCAGVAIAGTVAAAIFLPTLAAVAIGIPSIFLGLSSAMGTDGDTDSESILYLHPGTAINQR